MRWFALVGFAALVLGSCDSSGGGSTEPGDVVAVAVDVDVDVAVAVADSLADTHAVADTPPDHDVMPWNVTFELTVDGAQQRGPVVLRSSHILEESVVAEWRSDGVWEPATLLSGTGGGDVFVWDSMADVQEDLAQVQIKLWGFAQTNPAVGESAPFGLFNDPARERQVLITHDINGDDRVRQLTWTHGVGLGGGVGEVHQVGPSPRRVAFSPNGILAAVVEEGTEHVRILRFDLETGEMGGQATIPATGLYPVDAEFGGDGADLYVVHSNPNPEGGVYRVPIQPASGKPLDGAALGQIHSQFQAGDLEILPEGRGLALLAADPGGNLDGIHLAILSREGAVLGELGIGPEGSTSRSVVASPDGQWLLVTYSNFFGAGDGVVLVSLDDAGVPLLVNDAAVGDPEEVAWTGDSLTALVTEAMDNKVTGLALGGGALVKGTSFTLGLAERIAHTAWGPDRDTFLVTTVSANTGLSGLAVVAVGEGGVVTNTGTYELGDGIDKIPGDVAIQP